MSQSITKSTVYNILRTCSPILFQLAMFPYVARVLEPAGVGRVAFAQSVVAYAALVASLGIEPFAVRACSRVRGDRAALSLVASRLMSVGIFAAGAAYGLLALALVFWDGLRGYESLVLVLSVSIAFTAVSCEWLNTAMEDFRWIALRTLAFQVLSLVLVLVSVGAVCVTMVYAGILAVAAGGAGLAGGWYRRRSCTVSFPTDIDARRDVLPVLTFFGVTAATAIYTNTDITMLGVLCGDEEAGLYSTAVKVYNAVNRVVASVSLVVLPQAAVAFAEGDFRKVARLFRYALGVVAALGLPCAAAMYVFAPEILWVVGGDAYVAAAPVLRVLVFAILLSYVGGVTGSVLFLAAGRERIGLIGGALSAFVNFALNLYFIPRYGMMAAAWTTVAAEAVALAPLVCMWDRRVKLWRMDKTND